MAPAACFFGFTVQAYAMALPLAVWVGLWLSAREVQRLRMDGNYVIH
jgi:hypothetical protein